MGDMELLKEQVYAMTQRIAYLENALQHNQKSLIAETVKEVMKKQEKDPLKAEIIRKFNKHKREMIQSKILEIVRLKPTPVADVKYHIVDQLKYCSKASFYRYIEEMQSHIEIREGMAYAIQDITV